MWRFLLVIFCLIGFSACVSKTNHEAGLRAGADEEVSLTRVAARTDNGVVKIDQVLTADGCLSYLVREFYIEDPIKYRGWTLEFHVLDEKEKDALVDMPQDTRVVLDLSGETASIPKHGVLFLVPQKKLRYEKEPNQASEPTRSARGSP